MKEDNKWCVYKHTSPSGKVYIGITSQGIKKRWGNNGRCYRTQNVFYNAIKKYGWNNFKHEILFSNLSKEEACKKEIQLIKKYKSNCSKYYNPTFGYNQTDGGEGGNGYKCSDAQKKAMSERMIGSRNPFYGKHHTDEFKQAMSESRKGTMIGKDNPNYGNKWNKNQKYKASQERIGTIIQDSTIKKLSNTMSGNGNPMYGKHHNNYSIIQNKNNQPNLTKVKCVELNMIFESITSCARYFDTSPGSISSACRHKHLSKGYHFEFVEGSKYIRDRKINIYDRDMNCIKTCDNPKQVSIELDTRINNVWSVLRGDAKTTKGYILKYADEVENNTLEEVINE